MIILQKKISSGLEENIHACELPYSAEEGRGEVRGEGGEGLSITHAAALSDWWMSSPFPHLLLKKEKKKKKKLGNGATSIVRPWWMPQPFAPLSHALKVSWIKSPARAREREKDGKILKRKKKTTSWSASFWKREGIADKCGGPVVVICRRYLPFKNPWFYPPTPTPDESATAFREWLSRPVDRTSLLSPPSPPSLLPDQY